MTDPKKTNATSKEGFAGKGFKFCGGDSEEMSRMMRNFSSGENKTFDCRAMMQMMQKMCCVAPEKSGRQESSDN
jgi:hypothetical protein